MPSSASCKNQCYGGAYRSVLQLEDTADIPSSLSLFTVMMEAIRSSESSVPTRGTRYNIPEDGIRHRIFLLMSLSILIVISVFVLYEGGYAIFVVHTALANSSMLWYICRPVVW
jgi:hypothetical protein